MVEAETKIESKIIYLYPIDYPFETLVDRVKKGKLILNPDFQRKYKWNRENEDKTSKFIESCLMRIPLPACYFAETEDGKHIVIDGVQRITTIQRFFNDEFALQDLEVFSELKGKKFSELAQNLQAELENYTIRCIVLRKNNEEQLIQDIFARLNQGSVLLTAQEIRHALYPGEFDRLLTELAKNETISGFGQGKKDGLEAEELVLRFFAMQDLTNYDGNLAKQLNKYMVDKLHVSEDQAKEMKVIFEETLEKCLLVFGKEDVFRNPVRQKKPKDSIVFYDLLMWGFRELSREFLTQNKEIIKKMFAELCELPEFERTLSGGTQQTGSIKKRREMWLKKLEGITGGGNR